MGPVIVLRTRSSQILGVAMVAAALLALASAAVDGRAALLQYAAPAVLFGVLGWGAFWQPHIEVSDGGVLLANTLRSVQVPWPAIEEVDGRYGLRLRTAYGRLTAWSAGAPSGRDRTRAPQSEASVLVQQRLEELRGAGFLDNPRLERPRPVTTWHLPLIAAVVVLAVASATLPLLG
jgi:hypothetical protein